MLSGELPETATLRVEKGFFVGDHIGVANGGQKSDLIDGVLNLSFGQIVNPDLLQSVNAVVYDPSHLVDLGRLPLMDASNHLEIG